MAIVQSTATTTGPLFSSWDDLDTLFEKAFAPRLVSSPLPTLAYLNDMPKRPDNPTPSAQPMQVPVPKAKDAYSFFNPAGKYGPGQYASSLDSPLFSSPEPLKDPLFEKLWNNASRQVNRSTTTSIPQSSKTIRRRRSRLTLRESADSKVVTAMFDLPGVLKDDVHVSYQHDRLVVTWEYVKETEKHEDNKIVKERKEKKYIRTLVLPEGTKFEDIKATMDTRRLTVTYPKTTSSKAVPIS